MKGTGKEGILNVVVPELFIQPGVKSMFLQETNPDMHGDRPPVTQHTLHCRPRPDLAVHVDRAYWQPANMQPGTFCYH